MAQKTTSKNDLKTSPNHHDADEVLVTKEGLEKLKQELEHLKTEKRKQIADRLKEAISYGDLSENSEYEEAKNEQAFCEGRIIELEKQIRHAKIIKGKKANVVRIGSTVTITDLQESLSQQYTIVGSTEADPVNFRISNESPVGKALLGKAIGDTAIVEAPGGEFKYTVDEIK